MPDLSAYVDFSVELDKSGTTPVIVLTDTSAYPTGVPATVTGVFSVTQPDGIAIVGNFTTPDISWDGTALIVCTKILRLALDSANELTLFQNGNYTITYTVKATGYNDTVKTKPFPLIYSPTKIYIADLSDPFTPSLQVLDSTLYSVSGFTYPSLTRVWAASIQYVGSVVQYISSNSALFDLSYSGGYYDAHYNIAFSSIMSYTNILNNWVMVTDKISSSFQLDAYTPPTMVQLINSLTLMKQQIDSGTYCGGCNCTCEGEDSPFTKAQAIYDNFVNNGQNGSNLETLYTSVQQLTALFNCSGYVNTTHTNAVIPAYNWGQAVPPYVSHLPIQFTVDGGTLYAPINGATDYINPTLNGYNAFLVYSKADADFLTAGTDFNYINTGGFSFIGGRQFYTGDKYTLTFPTSQ